MHFIRAVSYTHLDVYKRQSVPSDELQKVARLVNDVGLAYQSPPPLYFNKAKRNDGSSALKGNVMSSSTPRIDCIMFIFSIR